MLDLEHYLEVMSHKPGTFAGSKPLAQWRAAAIRARLLGLPLVPARATEAAIGTALLALRAACSRS